MFIKARSASGSRSVSFRWIIFPCILFPAFGFQSVSSRSNNTDPRFADDQDNSIIPTWLQTLKNAKVESFEAPVHIQNNFPYYLSGFDEENRPIWVVEFGKWNLREIIEGGGENATDFETYAKQFVYRMIQSTSLKSTEDLPVSEFVIISDLDGYNLSQLRSLPAVTFILRMVTELVDALVQNCHSVFCVNTNFLAESLINLAKPLLGNILSRITIYGTNPRSWIPKLLRHLPKDQLPEWYGGTHNFSPVQVYG